MVDAEQPGRLLVRTVLGAGRDLGKSRHKFYPSSMVISWFSLMPSLMTCCVPDGQRITIF